MFTVRSVRDDLRQGTFVLGPSGQRYPQEPALRDAESTPGSTIDKSANFTESRDLPYSQLLPRERGVGETASTGCKEGPVRQHMCQGQG